MNLPRLVALSPGDLAPPDVARFLGAAGAALGAGLPALLFREALLPDADWLWAFERLLANAGETGAVAIAHDRLHLAQHAGARVAHLGFRSLPLPQARAHFDFERIGLSTHAGDDPAAWGDADYLFHGPLHPTPSKEGWQEPVGWAGLREAVGRAGARPVFAIGGLQPSDAANARGAGAHGVACLRGILGQADPAGATRGYLNALDGRP